MKKPFPRNVRLDRPGSAGGGKSARRRALERLLLSNRIVNRILANSARLALTALIVPRFIAPYRLELTRYPLPLPNLAPALRGYTILHLTDLHIGRTRQSYLESTIDRLLALSPAPDIILITGDLIDYHPRALPLAKSLLTRLAKKASHIKDGIITIFGNHDYHEYSWRHIGPRSAHRAVHKRLVKIVEDAGIKILRNQSITIERPPAKLQIVGLDELWTGLANPAAAFQNINPELPTLVLQHNPDAIFSLLEFPWHHMLCGHSHGGQANFPILGPLYIPMEHRQFLKGFFPFAPHPAHAAIGQNQPRQIFVSRGIGHSHPIRLRCPPEATVFSLCSIAPATATTV